MKILGMGLPELFMVLLFIGVLVLIVVLALRRSNKKKQSILETPCQQDGSFEVLNTSQVPVLETWKTSVGFSVLGAIVGFPLVMLLMILLSSLVSFGMASGIGTAASMAPELTSAVASALVTPIAAIFFYILTIVYATLFYPSYFGSKPKLRSSRAISFLNLTFGFVIFGVIWNSALTKRSKGASHIVLVVLTALMLVGMAVNVGSTIAEGLSYSQQIAQHQQQASDEGSSGIRVHDDESITEEAEGGAGSAAYKDHETGAAFLVPAGWAEAQLTKDQTFIDIKFFHGAEGSEDSAIMYGSYDLWNEWSDSVRAGLEPSDVDTGSFAKSDFADLLGCSEGELEQVTYGGNMFYKYIPSDYKDTASTVAMLACVDDGYLYQIQFWGQEQFYRDFEALAGSLTFK